MAKQDRQAVMSIIANKKHPGGETRQTYLKLEKPFPHNGRQIQLIYLKGATPITGRNGRVLEYKGKNADLCPITVDDNGNLTRTKLENGFPLGGCLADYAKDEYAVAADCTRSGITDLALGYGEFDEMKFMFEGQDHGVGWVMYGYEHTRDLRYFDLIVHLLFKADECMKKMIDTTAFMFGLNLALFMMKYAHKYVVFDNVGVIPRGVVIRDLETAVPIAPLTPAKRFGYYYLDFATALYCFIKASFDDKQKLLYPCWPGFIEGFFNERSEWSKLAVDEEKTSFMAQIKDDLKAPVDLINVSTSINIIEWLEHKKNPFLVYLCQALKRMAGISPPVKT